MLGGRRGDDDAIQIPGLDQVAPILAECAVGADKGGAFRIAAGEMGQPDAVQAGDGLDIVTAPGAGADATVVDIFG